ncbi:HAD hydrolase-like protein [Herbiconiux sp. P17]|uniref:HAD hydrolase-like protein n=1 Tax=Herbiconiux wuyangfengii TaxID=3342794 RepID=UPI0035BA75EB
MNGRTAMHLAPSLVIFDLDGTLIDSAANILAGLRATFAALGLPVPDDEELSHYIGPPVRQSFLARAGFGPERAQQAGRLYGRISDEHFRDGVEVYPGIRSALASIAARGTVLAIATSKPEPQALALLGEHGLRDHFAVVVGYEPSGRRESKAAIIREVVDRVTASSGAPARVVMVGDREHDLAGAHANGIDSVWVAWGYGDAAEGASATGAASEPRLLDQVVGEVLAPSADPDAAAANARRTISTAVSGSAADHVASSPSDGAP